MSKATLTEHLQAAVEATKSFAGGIVAEALRAVTAAQQEIVEIKADKPTATPLTIPAGGWAIEKAVEGDEETEEAYPCYYDVTVAGVTTKDRADIIVARSSMEAALACGLCPTTETLAGKIRLRAVRQPTQDMAAEYWISTGKE